MKRKGVTEKEDKTCIFFFLELKPVYIGERWKIAACDRQPRQKKSAQASESSLAINKLNLVFSVNIFDK